MSFKEPKDKKIIMKHRTAVLNACKLSIKKVHRFERECISNMYISIKQEMFDEIIDNFKINCKTMRR